MRILFYHFIIFIFASTISFYFFKKNTAPLTNSFLIEQKKMNSFLDAKKSPLDKILFITALASSSESRRFLQITSFELQQLSDKEIASEFENKISELHEGPALDISKNQKIEFLRNLQIHLAVQKMNLQKMRGGY